MSRKFFRFADLEARSTDVNHIYPAFDIVLPGRRRAGVIGATNSTTVGDLIRASGLDGRDAVVDGTRVHSATSLVRSGIRHGSVVEPADPSDPADQARANQRPDSALLRAAWVAGPDAGRCVDLAPGVCFIGRACTAAVRCCDHELELHHAVLHVGEGSAVVTQLSGRLPIMVDSEPITGPTIIAVGQRIDFGSSVLQILAAPDRKPASSQRRRVESTLDPFRSPVARSPRVAPTARLSPVRVPEPSGLLSACGGGLLPTVLGIAGAAVLAIVFDQPMFLLFGLVGGSVAFGTWVAVRLGLVRSRRSADRQHRKALDEFRAAVHEQQRLARLAHMATVPTIEWAVSGLVTRRDDLWAVRADDSDAFVASVGIGDLPWQPQIESLDRCSDGEVLAIIDNATRLENVAVPVCLGPGEVVAVCGPQSAAVARALIIQLAAASGPSDWQLAFVSDTPDEWTGLAWLPHAVSDVESLADRHTVIVVDAAVLANRTSSVRRMMASERSVAVIAVAGSEAETPMVATSTLVIGRGGRGRWRADARSDALAIPVRIAGISRVSAHDATAGAAGLIDLECLDDQAELPAQVDILALLGDDIGDDPTAMAHRIASSWLTDGARRAPAAPLGLAADGLVELDLVNDGPHILIAGTTGAGKSELLRSLVVGLAARMSPERITFVLVDFKGGATFDACAKLPHVVGLVTDLDGRLADRALRSLDAELRRREHVLREAGMTDLADRRAGRNRPLLPRLVVVIDEFATLAVQHPNFIRSLLAVAQRGRSLGVHLVLATQRPHGVVSDDVKANTNARIALRVQDVADSIDVIGVPLAAALARSSPGRALIRLGSEAPVAFQAAHCTMSTTSARGNTFRVHCYDAPAPLDDAAGLADSEGEPSALRLLTEAITKACALNKVGAPHRPWLPELTVGMSCPAGAVGVIDDPDRQARQPLAWSRESGHLLLAGAAGAGTTTTIMSLAAAMTSESEPPAFVLIDALGDIRVRALQSLSNCVGVVSVHERERLIRLLALLATEIAQRQADPRSDRRVDLVLLIDGLVALRTELEHAEMYDQLSELEAVIADGLGVGLAIVATTAQPTRLPSAWLSQFGQRWIFHLADPRDGAFLGVAANDVPDALPGRVVQPSGLQAQVVAVDEHALLQCAALRAPGQDRFDRIRRMLCPLPTVVPANALAPSTRLGTVVDLSIAISFASLSPVSLSVVDGEHILVVGPSRSGRTATLTTVAAAWHNAHPGSAIVTLAPRRSSARIGEIAACADELPRMCRPNERTLIVIDDAELVDDPTGVLSSLVTTRAEGVTVVAAGRPDALRAAYGHWTAGVRRSRLGFVMTGCGDLDGDLLGANLPRRLPIPARPGLAWQVADGTKLLVQIALSHQANEAALDVVGAAP